MLLMVKISKYLRKKSNKESKNKSKNKKMTYQSNYVNKVTSKLDVFKIEGKPTITISKELSAQINYLHNKFSRIEWSGPLLYKIESGDILDPSSLKIKCHYIHPMDVGSSTFTQVIQNPELFMEMEAQFDLINNDYKLGYCHTHHSMAAFFSGTDDDELQDNVKNYPYYLSLIVNFECKPVAKIVVVGKRVRKSTDDFLNYKSDYEGSDRIIRFTEQDLEKEVLCEISCNVEFEVDSWFEEYIDKVKIASTTRYTTSSYNNNYNHGANDAVGFRGSNTSGISDQIQYTLSVHFLHEFMVKHLFNDKNYSLHYTMSFTDACVNYKEWFDKNQDDKTFIDLKVTFEKMFEAHCSEWHKAFPTPDTKVRALKQIVVLYDQVAALNHDVKWYGIINEKVYRPLVAEFSKKLIKKPEFDQYEREIQFPRS